MFRFFRFGVCLFGKVPQWNEQRKFFLSPSLNSYFSSSSFSSQKMKFIGITDGKLRIEEGERPPVPSNGYLVKVYATAVNRADILQKQGKYPPPKGESNILGLEVAGVIDQVSSQLVSPKFKKGDRVCALLGGGGYAQYASVAEPLLMKIPSSPCSTLPYSHAAGIPEGYLTAFQTLYFHSNIHSFDTPVSVLIHAGASGVGMSAIQLVKFQNPSNKVIVTAGTDEKCESCRERGADISINYKKQNWKDLVLEKTGGFGVDILVDCIGGSYFNSNLKVLGKDGIMVMLGLLGGPKAESVNLIPFVTKGIKVMGSTLRNRPLEYKANLISSFEERCMDAFSTGKLYPLVDEEFDFENVEDAHQVVENNKNIGKIVLNISHDD